MQTQLRYSYEISTDNTERYEPDQIVVEIDGAIESLARSGAHTAEVLEILTSTQKLLLIGLALAPTADADLARDHLPTGTVEQFQARHLLDENRQLTGLGQLVARYAAYEAGAGPDPDLIAVVEADNAVADALRTVVDAGSASAVAE